MKAGVPVLEVRAGALRLSPCTAGAEKDVILGETDVMGQSGGRQSRVPIVVPGRLKAAAGFGSVKIDLSKTDRDRFAEEAAGRLEE